jgi:hypothetical protein
MITETATVNNTVQVFKIQSSKAGLWDSLLVATTIDKSAVSQA